jgi:hypothetical protein
MTFRGGQGDPTPEEAALSSFAGEAEARVIEVRRRSAQEAIVVVDTVACDLHPDGNRDRSPANNGMPK